MSRYYDRLLERGFTPPNSHKRMADVIIGELASATVVDMTNVARYYYAGTDQEEWIVSEDFPAIRSPFETAWYEFHHNGFIRSAKHGDHFESPITVGFLVRVMERGDYAMVYEEDPTRELEKQRPGIKFQAKWIQEALIFIEDDAKKVSRGPLGIWRFHIREDGACCEESEGHSLYEVASFLGNDPESNMRYAKAIEPIIYPILLGISFMHTTNVEQVTNNPPERVNKKRIKHGKQPLTTYKTLELRLNKDTRTREFGATGRDYYGRRLHLVRGQFRKYTKERPLFGKHVGQWWWNPHLRGHADKGEVKKDYKIGE